MSDEFPRTEWPFGEPKVECQHRFDRTYHEDAAYRAFCLYRDYFTLSGMIKSRCDRASLIRGLEDAVRGIERLGVLYPEYREQYYAAWLADARRLLEQAKTARQVGRKRP